MVSAPSGISGFETAFGSLMTLVHNGKIPLAKLVSKLTTEPARMLGRGRGRLGTLAVGAAADITVFDPDREWLVDAGEFASKGKNTPLAGSLLKGKVMATIVGGAMVFRDEARGAKSEIQMPGSEIRTMSRWHRDDVRMRFEGIGEDPVDQDSGDGASSGDSVQPDDGEV
jgi:formylmethanofuran dehydrogenase subunit A